MKKFCFLVGCLSIFTSGCLKTSLVEPVDPWGPSRSNIEETKITDHEVETFRRAFVKNDSGFLPPPLHGRNYYPFADDPKSPKARRSGGPSVCAVLVGDSWSFFDVFYQATEQKIRAVNPRCDIDFVGLTTTNPDTALRYPLVYPGTRAEQWGVTENAQLLINSLKSNNQRANLVVLFMTGNDLIKYYRTRYGQERKERILAKFARKTKDFIDLVQSGVSREIKFLVVGYVQPNLEEARNYDFGDNVYENLTHLDPRYHGPNPPPPISELMLEISTGLEKIEQKFRKDVEGKKNVEFVSNLCEFERNPAKSTPVDKMLYFYWDKVFYNDYFYVDPIHLGKNAQHRIAINTVTRAIEKKWLPLSVSGSKGPPVGEKPCNCDWPKPEDHPNCH